MTKKRKAQENTSQVASAEPPAAGLDPSRTELLPYVLNRLTSRLNQLWLDEIRDAGLTVQRWQVLSILAAFDGARIGQIAEFSGSEQPIVSRVIDQMERDGLVERKRAQGDSRAVQVWLTRDGRRLFDQLSPAADRYVKRLVQDLDPKDVTHAMRVLFQLLESVS